MFYGSKKAFDAAMNSEVVKKERQLSNEVDLILDTVKEGEPTIEKLEAAIRKSFLHYLNNQNARR